MGDVIGMPAQDVVLVKVNVRRKLVEKAEALAKKHKTTVTNVIDRALQTEFMFDERIEEGKRVLLVDEKAFNRRGELRANVGKVTEVLFKWSEDAEDVELLPGEET